MIRALLLAGIGLWIWQIARTNDDAPALASGDVLTLTPPGQALYERITPLAAHVFEPDDWTDLSPLDVAQLVRDAQDSSGIPALWMLYVIAHESRGNARAVGDGGAALGLVQTHRPWREYHAQIVASGKARTRAALELDPAALAVWLEDPREVPRTDVTMLAEALAQFLDRLARDGATWSATASLDDLTAAMLRHQRLPSEFWRQILRGAFTAPAPADPWQTIRTRAALAELEV